MRFSFVAGKSSELGEWLAPALGRSVMTLHKM